MKRSDDELTEEAASALGETEPASATQQPAVDEGAVYVAKLVDSNESKDAKNASEQAIRTGSPFRGTPQPAIRPVPVVGSGETSYADLGPFRYTAMGAALAAALVVAFASLGAWWFPVGGVLVAMLGAVLSVVGMFSTTKLRFVAIGSLAAHAGLFFVSYLRSIDS